MKTRQVHCLIAALLVSTASAIAQTPPPNDNFANATPLSGSSVTFTGTLVGATIEAAETNGTIHWPPNPYGSGSVWWTWTAPQSTTVLIVPLAPLAPHSPYPVVDVYSGPNITLLTHKSEAGLSLPHGRYGWFTAAAGETFHLRVSGDLTQPFSLQLIATNAPIFLVQPHDAIVSPHGSAFFGAIAAGTNSLGYLKGRAEYQWTFNGVPIPGEIYPSLLVHDVTSNNVGSYSVIASNAGGVVVSASASLVLVDTNPVPHLRASKPTASNSLPFTLTGEPGRWYEIESSTDFQSWVSPSWLQPTNASTSLSLPPLGPTHFIRASLDTPTDVCAAQLKQMFWAQYLFVIEQGWSPQATYGFHDVYSYIPLTTQGPNQGNPHPCPNDGIYSPGSTVLDYPTCSFSARGHQIIDLP